MLARLRHALLSPILLLALTRLLWAGNWVVGRAVRDDVPPIALTFWRWVIALALIAPLAWPHLRRQWPEVRAGWRSLLLLGLLGTGFYNALAYTGLQQTSAINGMLLNHLFRNRGVDRVGPARAGQFLYLMPAFGVLLSMFFLDERPALYHFAGVALIFGGIFLSSTARPGPV